MISLIRFKQLTTAGWSFMWRYPYICVSYHRPGTKYWEMNDKKRFRIFINFFRIFKVSW